MLDEQPLYISADNLVEWDGMKRASDSSYINDATVTYALLNSALVAVSGGTGSLGYVAASNGKYQGTIESTVAALLTNGARYFLDVTSTSGTLNDFRRIPCRARYHQARAA